MYNWFEKGLIKYFIVCSKYNGNKKNISLFNLIRFYVGVKVLFSCILDLIDSLWGKENVSMG